MNISESNSLPRSFEYPTLTFENNVQSLHHKLQDLHKRNYADNFNELGQLKKYNSKVAHSISLEQIRKISIMNILSK